MWNATTVTSQLKREIKAEIKVEVITVMIPLTEVPRVIALRSSMFNIMHTVLHLQDMIMTGDNQILAFAKDELNVLQYSFQCILFSHRFQNQSANRTSTEDRRDPSARNQPSSYRQTDSRNEWKSERGSMQTSSRDNHSNSTHQHSANKSTHQSIYMSHSLY